MVQKVLGGMNMSCFVVENVTVNRALSFVGLKISGKGKLAGKYREVLSSLDCYQEKDDVKTMLTKVGKVFLQTNLDAFNQRYDGRYTEGLENVVDDYIYEFVACDDHQSYKSLQCLTYQCAEGDVYQNDVHMLMKAILNAIKLHIGISYSDEKYQAAKWD